MAAKAAKTAAKTQAYHPLHPSVPVLLTKQDLCRAIGCGMRTLAEYRATGRFPSPDLHVGKMPRWRTATLDAWIEKQAAAEKRDARRQQEG